MDMRVLRMFQFQVQLQCRFVLRAADDIEAALKKAKTSDKVQDTFYGIQNLLNAAANISKAMWGPKGKLAAQRKELRDSLGVSDDSPLQEVNMRNNYEHFDERIERWLIQSKAHNMVDMCIYSVPVAHAIQGVEDTDRFREFNTASGNLVFWGEQFNIKAIIDEARRIYPVALQECEKPHGVA